MSAQNPSRRITTDYDCRNVGYCQCSANRVLWRHGRTPGALRVSSSLARVPFQTLLNCSNFIWKRHNCAYAVLDAVFSSVSWDKTKRCGHKAQASGYTKLPFAMHPHKKKRGFHRLPAEKEIECPRRQKPQLYLHLIIFHTGSWLRDQIPVVVNYQIENPVLDCSDISFLAMCTLYVNDWKEFGT
jgi:hypothetical protein